MHYIAGRKGESEMQKWMEDRCNLDIDIIALPGWSDATSKISLLMGDETQRPDIIWWWKMGRRRPSGGCFSVYEEIHQHG